MLVTLGEKPYCPPLPTLAHPRTRLSSATIPNTPLPVVEQSLTTEPLKASMPDTVLSLQEQPWMTEPAVALIPMPVFAFAVQNVMTQ